MDVRDNGGPGGELGYVQHLRLGFWWLSLAFWGVLGALGGAARPGTDGGTTRVWAHESGNRGFVGDWVPTVRCCGPGQGYQARPEAENARSPAWNAGDTAPEQPLPGVVSTEPGTSRLGMGASSNSGLHGFHGLLRNTAPPENSVGGLCCRVLCTMYGMDASASASASACALAKSLPPFSTKNAPIASWSPRTHLTPEAPFRHLIQRPRRGASDVPQCPCGSLQGWSLSENWPAMEGKAERWPTPALDQGPQTIMPGPRARSSRRPPIAHGVGVIRRTNRFSCVLVYMLTYVATFSSNSPVATLQQPSRDRNQKLIDPASCGKSK